MRIDGEALYFFVQHWGNPAGGTRREWVESSLDHLLFGGMTDEQKRGEKAARYRELMHPQSASSDLWQRFGIHGYVKADDAFAAMGALQERHPKMRFRVVRRYVIQTTTEAVRT